MFFQKQRKILETTFDSCAIVESEYDDEEEVPLPFPSPPHLPRSYHPIPDLIDL